ncbi:MAG: protein kinase [Pseudomonadota bacterium]
MNPDKHQNALNQNDRLHWYEIKSIIGQGGFGITYLARDTNLNHDVAIKEYLPIEYSTRDASGEVRAISEEHVEMFEWGKTRFLDEARTLFQFKHPNIVRVLSFFEFNNTGYMVMEYEEGADFADLIGVGETFDEEQLLEVILPIIEGLTLVHEQGFIHRDIKPRNIVIRSDGSPVLIDFGSARQAMGEQTRTLTTLVTPGYSPLEQYHEAIGKQGPWTDIYALGSTLYAAITHNSPADALKRSAARAEHKTDAYLRLTDLKGHQYSNHFLTAIDHALEFVAKDRPQNLTQWGEMLCGQTPVPPASPVGDVYLGPANLGEVSFSHESPPSESAPTAAKAEPGQSRVAPLIVLLMIALGAAIYIKRDQIAQFIATKQIEPVEVISTSDVQRAEPAITGSPPLSHTLESDAPEPAPQPLVEDNPVPASQPPTEEKPETSAIAPIESEPETAPAKPVKIVPQPISVNLAGWYSSEIDVTRNDLKVNPNWYFGEVQNLQIQLEHQQAEILGFIDGSREGRIEGNLSGNEINFRFYVIDPSGNTNQGRGIWFVAQDGLKMIGKWSLVNPADGEVFLEGNWQLSRLQ